MSTPTKPEPAAGAPGPGERPAAQRPPAGAKHYPPPPPPRPARVNPPVPQPYAPAPPVPQSPAPAPWQQGVPNPPQTGQPPAGQGYGQPYGASPAQQPYGMAPAPYQQQPYGMPSGPYQQQPYGAQAIVPHWALSIVSVLFSGIIGIVALYFSAQVQPRLVSGNVAGAADASKKAKIISIVGIVIGVLAAMVVFSGSSTT